MFPIFVQYFSTTFWWNKTTSFLCSWEAGELTTSVFVRRCWTYDSQHAIRYDFFDQTSSGKKPYDRFPCIHVWLWDIMGLVGKLESPLANWCYFLVASSIVWFHHRKKLGLIMVNSYNDPLSNIISAPPRNMQRISFHRAVWPVGEANSTLQPPDGVLQMKHKYSQNLCEGFAIFIFRIISLTSKKIQAIYCCWRRFLVVNISRNRRHKSRWEGTTLGFDAGQFLFGLMLTRILRNSKLCNRHFNRNQQFYGTWTEEISSLFFF